MRFTVIKENRATESRSEVLNDTSSMIVFVIDTVDDSVAEISYRSLDVSMFLIEQPENKRFDRITVINGSEIRLLPSITLFMKTTLPKKEERGRNQTAFVSGQSTKA